MTRAGFAGLACLVVAACGGNAPSAPTSTAPSQTANRPPTVTLAFQGASSCVPIPPRGGMWGKACTLVVVAQASDPDGDPLTYKWTGCGNTYSGENHTDCYVNALGPVTSTVEVSDGHGHSAVASVVGEGVNPPPDFVNHPPEAHVGYVVPSKSSSEVELLGYLIDPDEGEMCGGGNVGIGGCPFIQALSVSGDCETDRYRVQGCSCLEGLTVDVYRTKQSGSCTLAFTLRDSWGLSATSAVNASYGQTGNSARAMTLRQPRSTSPAVR